MNEVLHRMNGRLIWTDGMNNKLMECKRQELLMVNSSEPPRLDSGRKKGYMAVMKDLWEYMGYEELGLTSQNLETNLLDLRNRWEMFKARFQGELKEGRGFEKHR